MALVTVQRSPSPSNSQNSGDLLDGDLEELDQPEDDVDLLPDIENSGLIPRRSRRFSESYFAVKGAALILPQSECTRRISKSIGGDNIQTHLQSMFYQLRPQDTIKVAVKLESQLSHSIRYLVVVSCNGKQDTEESVLLGMDCGEETTIGMVLPIWADTKIELDGDGGFKVSSDYKQRIFKPVSVQAMWSALQSLHRATDTARSYNYFPGGLTHTWIGNYEARISSDRDSLNEWEQMEDLESVKNETMLMSRSSEKIESVIRNKLREVMTTVDLEEVTCKFIRTELEKEMAMDLKPYKSYIDQEMLVIMGQMDAASEIFDFLYLGSEWNASDLEELKKNGVGYILNMTREIDNFFPGLFHYMNVREYDVPETDLLKYWDKTYRFISKAKQAGSKVLVHCKMGVSRSASTVISFAMKEYGWDLKKATDFVRSKRSCIKPNEGFTAQLQTYQGILDASNQRELWRCKSESNLLSCKGGSTADEQDENCEGMDSLFPGDDMFSYGGKPRSWSGEDEEIGRLMMRFGPSTGAEEETQSSISETLSPSYIVTSSKGEEPIKMTDIPAIVLQDKFDMDVEISSRSADSMDDVFPNLPSPEGTKLPTIQSDSVTMTTTDKVESGNTTNVVLNLNLIESDALKEGSYSSIDNASCILYIDNTISSSDTDHIQHNVPRTDNLETKKNNLQLDLSAFLSKDPEAVSDIETEKDIQLLSFKQFDNKSEASSVISDSGLLALAIGGAEVGESADFDDESDGGNSDSELMGYYDCSMFAQSADEGVPLTPLTPSKTPDFNWREHLEIRGFSSDDEFEFQTRIAQELSLKQYQQENHEENVLNEGTHEEKALNNEQSPVPKFFQTQVLPSPIQSEKSRLISTSSLTSDGLTTPEGSADSLLQIKVRPDTSWIKSEPESIDPISPSSTAPADDANDPLVTTHKDIDQKTKEGGDPSEGMTALIDEQTRSRNKEIKTESDENLPQTENEKASVCGDKTMDTRVEIGIRQHYKKEDIKWSPGTVKRQLQDIESRSAKKGHTREPSNGSDNGSVDSDISNKSAQENLTPNSSGEPLTNTTPFDVPKGSPDGSGKNTPIWGSSVEDVCLTPGTVRRTTQEFEEKQRSVGYEDMRPSKPVHRSSSLKTIRPSKYNRDDERRKTCMPVISRRSPLRNSSSIPKSKSSEFGGSSDPVSTSSPLSIWKRQSDPDLMSPGNDSTGTGGSSKVIDKDAGMEDDAVIKICNEDVPLQQGIVKRQTKDFESRTSESEISTLSDKSANNQLATINQSESRIEKGHKRQKSDPKFGQISQGVPTSSPMISAFLTGTDVVVGSVKQQLEAIEQNRFGIATPEDSSEDPLAADRIKMDSEMLSMIRQVGTCFLESPAKEKTPEQLGKHKPGRGLVQRITNDIENKSCGNVLAKSSSKLSAAKTHAFVPRKLSLPHKLPENDDIEFLNIEKPFAVTPNTVPVSPSIEARPSVKSEVQRWSTEICSPIDVVSIKEDLFVEKSKSEPNSKTDDVKKSDVETNMRSTLSSSSTPRIHSNYSESMTIPKVDRDSPKMGLSKSAPNSPGKENSELTSDGLECIEDLMVKNLVNRFEDPTPCPDTENPDLPPPESIDQETIIRSKSASDKLYAQGFLDLKDNGAPTLKSVVQGNTDLKSGAIPKSPQTKSAVTKPSAVLSSPKEYINVASDTTVKGDIKPCDTKSKDDRKLKCENEPKCQTKATRKALQEKKKQGDPLTDQAGTLHIEKTQSLEEDNMNTGDEYEEMPVSAIRKSWSLRESKAQDIQSVLPNQGLRSKVQDSSVSKIKSFKEKSVEREKELEKGDSSVKSNLVGPAQTISQRKSWPSRGTKNTEESQSQDNNNCSIEGISLKRWSLRENQQRSFAPPIESPMGLYAVEKKLHGKSHPLAKLQMKNKGPFDTM
ncbi:unnamed protein product [Owenia fusiformis]|uniref:protein-serine/threonine phosphatase n=1 Tax=Owenia fusiformis TaxID=6347 RepID=A0A8S4Q6T6_OWEFU|nr:unnamed protein product [Owenia fusiformis]